METCEKFYYPSSGPSPSLQREPGFVCEAGKHSAPLRVTGAHLAGHSLSPFSTLLRAVTNRTYRGFALKTWTCWWNLITSSPTSSSPLSGTRERRRSPSSRTSETSQHPVLSYLRGIYILTTEAERRARKDPITWSRQVL